MARLQGSTDTDDKTMIDGLSLKPGATTKLPEHRDQSLINTGGECHVGLAVSRPLDILGV